MTLYNLGRLKFGLDVLREDLFNQVYLINKIRQLLEIPSTANPLIQITLLLVSHHHQTTTGSNSRIDLAIFQVIPELNLLRY